MSSPAQGPYLTRDATNNSHDGWYPKVSTKFSRPLLGALKVRSNRLLIGTMDHRLVFNLSLLELMLKSRLSRRLGCFHRLPIDVLQEESKVSSTLHSLRKLAILRTEMCDRPFQIVTDIFIRLKPIPPTHRRRAWDPQPWGACKGR